MQHELKELFHKKREEAKGSRERIKYFAAKCVQAHNEAEKRKALGRPGIDPKMAAKKKKPTMAQAVASRQEAPRIVFPASMTGSKPKVPTVASEQKKSMSSKSYFTRSVKKPKVQESVLNTSLLNVFKLTMRQRSARHLGVQASTPRWLPRRRSLLWPKL